MQTGKIALFAPAPVVASRAAKALLDPHEIADLADRHRHGDWGTVDDAQAHHNEKAIKDGFRLLSAYEVRGVTFIVVTEFDRVFTSIIDEAEL